MWENNFFSCSKVLERLKYAQNRSFCDIQKCHFSSKLSAQSQSSNDIDIMLSLLMVLVLVADQLAMQDTESVFSILPDAFLNQKDQNLIDKILLL
jgi:hypothetical protein